MSCRGWKQGLHCEKLSPPMICHRIICMECEGQICFVAVCELVIELTFISLFVCTGTDDDVA